MKTFADIVARSHENTSGFEMSWAGANPFGDGFCFGSENGLLQFMDMDIRPIGQPIKVSVSGDAINSVTGTGSCLAASTRQEITFVAKAKSDAKPEIFQLPFGAYHLECTSNGYIVAAIGRKGLVFVDSKSPTEQLSAIDPDSVSDIFAYSVLTFSGSDGKEVIVCAGRTSGIFFCEWRPNNAPAIMQSMSFADLDVIDVCSIATDRAPFAIAGADIDGTLVLAHDVLNDKKPVTLKFASIRGVVYRLVHCQGHLFVLTSNGLLVLWNLARDFTGGIKTKVFDTPILAISMKAVDMNLVMNRYLAVVTIDGIQVIDIDSISGPDMQSSRKPNEPVQIKDDRLMGIEWETERPEWKSEGFAVGV